MTPLVLNQGLLNPAVTFPSLFLHWQSQNHLRSDEWIQLWGAGI